MKDIKHIRRDFHSVAWVMPKGLGLGGAWGPKFSFSEHGSCPRGGTWGYREGLGPIFFFFFKKIFHFFLLNLSFTPILDLYIEWVSVNAGFILETENEGGFSKYWGVGGGGVLNMKTLLKAHKHIYLCLLILYCLYKTNFFC